MTDREIDTLVAARNPIDGRALAGLELDGAELALREDVLSAWAPERARAARRPWPGRGQAAVGSPRTGAAPAGTARAGATRASETRRGAAGAGATPTGARRRGAAGAGATRGDVPRRGIPRPRLLAGVAATAVLALVAVLTLTGREPGEAGTAWAAPLVHLAESSPLLLVGQPDWAVSRADETDAIEGEMTFTHGAPVDLSSATASFGHTAELNWRRGALEDWQRDRAGDAALVVHRVVLGQPAQISQYRESRGVKDFTAIWPDAGAKRVLEFRAVADDLAAFERLVGSLKRVDVNAWLSAMPASVVKSANRPDAVTQMLADIPLPPGFDAGSLESAPLVSDRYQLGAKVTAAVSCAWIDRWAAARGRGDAATAREAVAAMQTSHHWKILDEMTADGAWPAILRNDADAMKRPDATAPAAGKPLQDQVRSGLGCGG
jgi:hypothetical protein